MKKIHEDIPLPEGAVISNSFRYSVKSRILPKIRKSKLLLLGILIVCLLGAGILIVLAMKKQSKNEAPFLTVGRYSYTKSEYDKRIAQAKDMKINEFDARKSLTAAFAARQAADDLKISYPTDQTTLNYEAARVYKLDYETPAIKDYQRDTAYSSLIKPFVTFGVHGGYKVGYVEFPFSRYIVAGDNTQFHNLKLIQDDITYAKTLAEQYRQAIVNNKQSVTEVADKVRADTRLTYGQAGNMSEVFFSDEAGNMYSSRFSGNMVQSWLFKSIKQAEVGKISEIMTKSWSNSTGLKLPSIQHGTDVDIAYYFLIVQEKSAARPGLQAEFDKRVQEYSR